jgi:hypothetical protein
VSLQNLVTLGKKLTNWLFSSSFCPVKLVADLLGINRPEDLELHFLG